MSAYATVEWAGNVKKTRTVKKSNISELIYFHIPMEEEIKKDPGKLADYLNDELETKSEIIINVWADSGKAYIDNLGSSKVCLKILHS